VHATNNSTHTKENNCHNILNIAEQMNNMDPNWVWASGGLCAGCMVGVCVTKVMDILAKKTIDSGKKTAEGEQQPFDIDNVNHIGKFNDQITTYSNITMLLGSPTGSALLDTHEYNLYPAEKGYPLLKGNR